MGDETALEKKMEELNLEFQGMLGKILETHDAQIIMQSILVLMGSSYPNHYAH